MSTLRVTTISNAGGTKTVPADTVVDGTAKAWVNFNGTGTPTIPIRAAFNVSTITDNGVGDYTVNFTSALTDANYSMVGACDAQGASGRSISVTDKGVRTSSTCRIGSAYVDATTSGSGDGAYMNVAFFR